MTTTIISLKPNEKITVGTLYNELSKLVETGKKDFTILLVSHHEDDYHEPKHVGLTEPDLQLVIW